MENTTIDAGYQQQWRNTVEYIEDITYRIWESRDIDFIQDTYSDDCPVFMLSGGVSGADTVVNGTKATLETFPDRTLFPQEILWNGRNSGTDQPDTDSCSHGNVPGYHSAHLIRSTMTFAPAEGSVSETSDVPIQSWGKRGTIWVIAHCIISNGVIVKEWLVRENEYLFQQLDVDVDQVAKKWAQKWQKEESDGSWEKGGKNQSHLSWLNSEYQRVQALAVNDQIMELNLDNVLQANHRLMYHHLCMSILNRYVKVWGTQGMQNKEMFSQHLKQIYHPHARLECPHGSQKGVVGHADIEDTFDAFVLGNGNDVAMVIDWAIIKPGEGNRRYNGENRKPTNAWRYPCDWDRNMHVDFLRKFEDGCEAAETFTMAVRWTAVGKPKQGNPQHTLVPVVVMGESYLHCAGFRIIHEIMVYDNVAVKAQLHIEQKTVNDNINRQF